MFEKHIIFKIITWAQKHKIKVENLTIQDLFSAIHDK